MDKNYESKMFAEFADKDRREFRRDWILSFMRESGEDEEVASLMYEEYLNQEGYTSRDERIGMERARSLPDKVQKSGPPENYDGGLFWEI